MYYHFNCHVPLIFYFQLTLFFNFSLFVFFFGKNKLNVHSIHRVGTVPAFSKAFSASVVLLQTFRSQFPGINCAEVIGDFDTGHSL